MVAWAGLERLALGLTDPPPSLEQVALEMDGMNTGVDVELKPRWPLGERDPRGMMKAKGMKKSRISAALTPAIDMRPRDTEVSEPVQV